MSSSSGRLWIVATPLGNPGDLSPRANALLGTVDVILAEDTRRSGLLLATCGINAKRFVSLHDHNEKSRLPAILEELKAGAEAALVSDAGTPLISDPGYQLVKACREAGIPVSPVPGPSAPMAALSASGIAPLPFAFLGFPPRGKGDIRNFFKPYAALSVTLVFFERKDRLAATLDVAQEILGKREGCIAREMTKTYEEFIPFRLDEKTKQLFAERELLGEITVVLGPPLESIVTDEADVLEVVRQKKDTCPDAKPREIAKQVQPEVSGWSVGDIYALLQKH
ncbi:16S rRNA (cytidine(1402)-2'-O)-methyltransferase [Desulfovibrio sp. OttesenSCG-928-O18]|nr:16S rRNA (cytidine(1402)-2'-O)-methyltransferase [Desulfovibrio sp. OttesenSCG-928-O18]